MAWVKILVVCKHRRIVGRRGYNMQGGAGAMCGGLHVHMLGYPGDRGVKAARWGNAVGSPSDDSPTETASNSSQVFGTV